VLPAECRLKATNETEQESAIAQLCADLKRPIPALAPPPDCPYPGMKPFGSEDNDRFFGRDQEIAELIERLRLHPCITVIGPSGSGKSSLVLAGLIPTIKKSRLLGTGEWQIRSMRPGETPETTLRKILGEEVQVESARVLLLIDQFEELFTLAKEEALPFQESLLKLAKTTNIYLILTVRADFYADLMTSLLWPEIQNYRLEVVPLNETGLRQAILKPAENVGVFVEPALVERLVADAAGEPGILPLIQETLVLLWQRLERRFLPLRAYEALVLPRAAYGGQEPGHKTGLLVAIARRADQAIKDLKDDPEQQHAIARRIFLRLIQFGEGRADTRRQQSVESLGSVTDNPALFKQTLAHLVDCRLLTPSGDDKNSSRKIDIAHEALITGWPTLQQWITERREVEQTRRRLAASAEEWVRLGSGSGGLLDKIELAEAQRWLDSPDAIDLGYEMSLTELIAASRSEIEAVERQAAEQQERELNLVRERLAEEQRARKAAQTRNLIAGISLVLLAGITAFAFIQRNQAERNRQEAEQQTLISQVRAFETLVASEQRLKALVQALKIAKALKEKDGNLQNSQAFIVALQLQQAMDGMTERNQLGTPENWVLGVDVSPDGQTIASASQDNTIRLWRSNGAPLMMLQDPSLKDPQDPSLKDKAHTDAVLEVNFSPDGQLLASASRDKTIKVWQVKDGKLIKTFQDKNWISSLSFSPNGQLIAAACADKTVKIWSLNSNKPVKILPGHTNTVMDLNFNKAGSLLASVSKDGTVKLWDTVNWKLRQTFSTPGAQIFGVSFSPDSQTVVSSNDDNPIKLWALKSGIGTNPPRKPRSLPIRFSPDGQAIAAAGLDGVISILDKDGKPLEKLKGHQQSAGTVRFNPKDSNVVVSGSLDGTIRIWDRRRLPSSGAKLAAQTTRLAFNPDRASPIKLASAHEDGRINLWKQDGTLIKELKGQKDYISSLKFSPDGRSLVSSSIDKTIRLWNLETHSSKALTGHTQPVTDVSFSPDGNLIASASQDRTIKLWKTSDGQLQKTLEGHQDWVSSLDFSPDGKLIASGSSDNTVKLWTAAGRLVQTLEGNQGVVKFSPDGHFLATSNEDTVRLWKRTGERVEAFGNPFKGHSDIILSLRFSPDSQVLVSVGLDNTIRLWSLDGSLLYTLRESQEGNDSGSILEVAISADGKDLALSKDGAAVIRALDFNSLMRRGCSWVHDYLQTNASLSENERHLCDGIEN
jgi:WD40 repeat protein